MRDAEAADGPLSDAELDDLFAAFAGARLIALAVSGGADSLALMVAAARWRAAAPRQARHRGADRRSSPAPRLAARGGGRGRGGRGARACTAACWCARATAPTANIEAEARGGALPPAARLRRGRSAPAISSPPIIATISPRPCSCASQRGAGVFGLAAMRPAVDAGGIVLARPFLAVPRARLAATTAAAGLTPAVDAMNSDPRFARARVRAAAAAACRRRARPGRACRDGARGWRDAADAIDAAASELIAAAVTVDRLRRGAAGCRAASGRRRRQCAPAWWCGC